MTHVDFAGKLKNHQLKFEKNLPTLEKAAVPTVDKAIGKESAALKSLCIDAVIWELGVGINLKNKWNHQMNEIISTKKVDHILNFFQCVLVCCVVEIAFLSFSTNNDAILQRH